MATINIITSCGSTEASFTENLIDSIIPGKTTYNTQLEFKQGSLDVFLNGLLLVSGSEYDEGSDFKSFIFKLDDSILNTLDSTRTSLIVKYTKEF